jgi:hypothetical protein
MSACPQCGAAARPTDKFCNACGTPIARASSPPRPMQGPAPNQPFAAAPGYAPAGTGRAPARCQMGHEIAPGANFCPQGHMIALEPMQSGGDPYAGAGFAPPPGGSYGAVAPPPPIPGFGTPAAPPVYGPPPGQGAFAAAAMAPTYGVGEPPREPVPPKALCGFLVAYGTNPSGDFWPLTGGRLTIGRFGSSERMDIALQDPTISSRHAAMLVDPIAGTIVVEDTGSTNGTFVNDEHIGFNGRRDLRDGDRVRFGAYTTIVKVIARV